MGAAVSDHLPDTRRAVDQFIDQVRATPTNNNTGRRGRLVFAMDATASREPTWDRACHIQAEMFTETAALGGLDVQLVFYRGFGECKASPWVANSEKLVKLMTSVRCLGGRTQIAKILTHTLKETQQNQVNALVFVGDCMEEDVDELCHHAGELGLLGVPAFIFHEGGEPVAANAFRQIAKLTGGAYCAFDSASARQLRDLLAAVAVFAAGGRTALEKRGGDAVKLLTSQLR